MRNEPSSVARENSVPAGFSIKALQRALASSLLQRKASIAEAAVMLTNQQQLENGHILRRKQHKQRISDNVQLNCDWKMRQHVNLALGSNCNTETSC
jgi:hypothetical protein